jgi:putative hemolysin
VVEFYDVDVAEVMTPRTELTAVELGQGAREVVRAIASSGHTRIPVYEKSLDSIVGVVFAQEMVELVADGRVEECELRDLVRPVHFVPETKLVSELLADFRRDKQKLAVVLDEYGGTSGIVTMGDVVAELVGEMREELGEEPPIPIRRMPDGTIEIQGTTRVGEVNEELELELPEEEDYDTLAGFVLSELGRFPKPGEAFERKGLEFTVMDASDRRVHKILLRLPQAQGQR